MAAFVMCLFGAKALAQESITLAGASIPVVATETVNVTEYSGVTYSDKRAEYDAAKLATALGVTDLADASLYIVNVTTNEAVENTSDGWRNGAGDLCGWGDITEESKGYCVKILPASDEAFDHWGQVDYLGAHHLGVWAAGETFTALWGIVANEKAALVKVVVSFIEKPSAPQAEYVTDINVVSSIECSSDRESLQGTDADTITVNVGDLKTLLGVDKEELLTADWFYLLPCTDTYDTNSQVATGQVAVLSDVDGWVHQVNDVETAAPIAECCASTDNTGNAFRVSDFTYDAEAGTLTFLVSQKAGTNLSTDKLFTTIYILYNDKAVSIKYTMNIAVSEIKGLSDMTSVGSTTVSVDAYPASGYETVDATFDLEAVATALGCSAENITFKMLADENTFYMGAPTEGSGGWFLDANGYPCAWRASETSAMWYITEPSTGAFQIGQDGGHYKTSIGDVYTTHLYATYAEKYYEIIITLNIVEKNVGDWTQWKSVATRNVKVQQLKTAAEYVWSDAFAVISFEDLESLIGTASPTLYGNATEADMEAAGGCPYTDTYTISEKPGFWMDANAVSVGWGNGSVWGVSGQRTNSAFPMPEGSYGLACMWMTTAPVETPYTGNLYLVNTANGKMITINLSYQLVEEIRTTEEIGRMNVVMPVSGDEYEKEFDLEPIATALGCTVDDLNDNYTLADMSGAVAAVQPSTGLEFSLEGKAVEAGNGVYGIYFESGSLYSWANEEVAADYDQTVEIGFVYDNKIYVVQIRFMNYDLYTGIKEVNTDVAKGAVYDLSGRRVSQTQKGIYIQNGKKILK